MLHLIWLVLLLLVVAVYGIRKRYRMLASFLKPSLIAVMVPEYSAGRRWTKALLLVLSLFFVVLSLTGPEVGFRWETVEQKGIDIMIALDCSRSMLATDIKPSRLEQAKREIIDLLNMMQSDRAGLVAFAGSAVLQCPLTLDHSAFHIFLKALNPDYLPRGGTDISGAIQTALDGFESDVNSEKAILLITDGENTSGDPMEIVQDAAKAGVRIFCIGVGREEGAPVPDGSGGFKKDDQGRIIMSKVDDAALRKIAAMGMGRYVKSVAGDMDLDLIYTQEILKNMERTTIRSGRKKVWENRFQWLLFPAVALLFFELLISEGKPTRKKKIKSVQSKTSRTGASIDSSVGKSALILLISCLLALTMWSAPGRADAGTYTSVKKGIENFGQGKFEEAKKNFIDAQLKNPEMSELYYNIGSAAYKSGAYDEALNNFTRAMDTEDPELKDKSRFNLGNTKFRMEDFEGAIEAFEGIPAGSKLHKKAADNIAFVKKVMEEKKRQQEQQKKEGDQKKKEDQDAQKDQDTQKNQGEKKKPDDQNQKKDQNQAPNDQSSQEEQQGSGQDKNGQERPQEQQKKEQQKQNQQKEEMQNNDPADQEEKTEGNSSNGHQDKPSQQQNSEEKSDKTDGVDPKNVAAQQAQQQQGHQRLLNRLEDKPGAAMVPVYSGKPVEKDW